MSSRDRLPANIKNQTVNINGQTMKVSEAHTDFDTNGIAQLRETLREELDIHSSFTPTKFLREGIDAHFNCRIVVPGGLNYTDIGSKYWVQENLTSSNDGRYILKENHAAVSHYSKKTFSCPIMGAYLKLPDWAGIGEGIERDFWFGFETGGSCGTGIASFRFMRTAANVDLLYIVASGSFFKIYAELNIIALLPANYKTAGNAYIIKVSNNSALFYVNSTLLGILQFTPNYSYNTGFITATAPYGLACVPIPISQHQTAFIEIMLSPLTNSLSTDLTVPLTPMNFRVNDGDIEQPLNLPLYKENTNTLLVGLIVNPNVTSHPIPAFGYSKKTMYFKANGAGTLSIQVRTNAGNWVEYDSVAVAANILIAYPMTGDCVLFRIVFTPTAAPATISDAEVTLV